MVSQPHEQSNNADSSFSQLQNYQKQSDCTETDEVGPRRQITKRKLKLAFNLDKSCGIIDTCAYKHIWPMTLIDVGLVVDECPRQG